MVEEDDYEMVLGHRTPGILPGVRATRNRRFARLGSGGISTGRK
jgi:hypothetical protein